VNRAKHDSTRDIAVYNHLVEGGTHNGTLNGFALVERKAGSGKGIPNAREAIESVCSSSVVYLHPDLQNSASKQFGCLFHDNELCCLPSSMYDFRRHL
jgi:hypothetical protein